jgi:hypothetical protein
MGRGHRVERWTLDDPLIVYLATCGLTFLTTHAVALTGQAASGADE